MKICLAMHFEDGKRTCNSAPLLADLFLYLYKADFIEGLLNKDEKKLTQSFNFTLRYIDDVMSLNNSQLGDFVDRINPIELEIQDTTDTTRSASYRELNIEIYIKAGLERIFTYKRITTIFQ